MNTVFQVKADDKTIVFSFHQNKEEVNVTYHQTLARAFNNREKVTIHTADASRFDSTSIIAFVSDEKQESSLEKVALHYCKHADELAEILKSSNIIEKIRRIRQATNCDLNTAKEFLSEVTS